MREVIQVAVQGMELSGIIIVVSDRIYSGERKDEAGALAGELLTETGVDVLRQIVVPEGETDVSVELKKAVAEGVRVIITVGGTGVGPRNRTPEATTPLLETELSAVMSQILFAGLQNTHQAGLSRGLVGLTAREPGASLIVNAPSSVGGVRDALGVVGPLLGPVFERLY